MSIVKMQRANATDAEARRLQRFFGRTGIRKPVPAAVTPNNEQAQALDQFFKQQPVAAAAPFAVLIKGRAQKVAVTGVAANHKISAATEFIVPGSSKKE